MPITGIGAAAEVDPVASLVAALNTATSALTASTAASLQKSSNLSDLVSASTARTNLGLGSAATLSTAQVAADSALTGAFAALGATAPAAQVPPKRSTTLLANLGVAGHGYTANSNAASSNMNDTTSYVMGTQCASLVTKGDGAFAGIRKTGISSMNLSAKCIEVTFRVTNTTHLKNVSLYLGDGNFANFNVYTLFDTAGGPVGVVGEGEWVTVTVNTAAVGSTTGSPNLAAVTAMQVTFADDNTGAGNAITGYLQSVKSFAKTSTYTSGVVSLTFDDGYASQWSTCRPRLETYGYQGTFYTISDVIGLNASYLTLAQLRALQDNAGHEVAAHAYTEAYHTQTGGYTALSSTELDVELRTLKNWLTTYGFMARDHFCYPQGLMTPTMEQIVKRYFSSARVTQRYPYESTSPGNIHRMRTITCNTPRTLADVEAVIDLAYSGGFWLILTFHDVVTSPTGGSIPQWATSDYNSLIDYINSKGIPVKTVGDVLANP